jgi:hypothetical protein
LSLSPKSLDGVQRRLEESGSCDVRVHRR